MKTIKIIAGVFFALVAFILLTQAFGSVAPESYEKLGAFLIAGGLSFWFLKSAFKKNKNL